MSIQNLVNSDINSMNVVCTVAGAITGTATVNLKRLDNLVYLSFEPFVAAASAAPSFTLTPNVTIPAQYRPVQGLGRFLSVSNNGSSVLGQVAFSQTLAPMTFTLQAGGNFSGTSGIVDNTLVWKVNNQ